MATLRPDIHPDGLDAPDSRGTHARADEGGPGHTATVRRTSRLQSWARTFERYFTPSFVVCLWIYFRDRALVSLSAKVQLSSSIRFGKGTVVKPFAIVQTSGGRVITGRDCRISAFNQLAAGSTDLIIGDQVRTGAHVVILASTREYRRRDIPVVEQGYRDRGIVIGNDVFIGSHAVILDGARLGDGVVVGAGSVVTGTVEPYTIVMGIPAKRVGERK